MKQNLILILMIILLASCQKNDPFSKFENTNTPVVLGEGSLSKDSVQWNNFYVSKTKELYFTKMGKSASNIYKMNYENDEFTNLEKIDLPYGSPHSDVYLNPKGNMMLFSSIMQENEKDTLMDWNIWKSIKKDGKWQKPMPFFDRNVEGNQFYPFLTHSGNLYFAITPHGSQNSDLYVSEFKKGNYTDPISLSGINSERLEGDAFVSPDESYIIFAGFDRKENLGKSDLFISFNNNGVWSDPTWLGKEINSEGYDGSPFVTEDGKYLIFTSSRGSTDQNTYFNHYILRFDPNKYRK